MMGKCSKCSKTFDSHDGGFACLTCGYTVCPKCEVTPEGADEPICTKCNAGIEKKISVAGPKITIHRRGGGVYEVSSDALIKALQDFDGGGKGTIPILGKTKIAEITITSVDLKWLPEWIRKNIIGEPVRPPLRRVLDLMDKQKG